MVRFALILALLFSMLPLAEGQWTLQQSSTTADLRAIDNVGNGIAWASGSNGTILRTTDNGHTWQRCTIPPNAEKLDFRGVKGFEGTTALAMSSGTGTLSRLYATTDECRTWNLLLTNPDPEGFFDALQSDFSIPLSKSNQLFLVGDPVKGRFPIWRIKASQTRGHNRVFKIKRYGGISSPRATPGQAAFAASNTALALLGIEGIFLATGGTQEAVVFSPAVSPPEFDVRHVPVGNLSATSGIFSIALDQTAPMTRKGHPIVAVAVGGDYSKPDAEQQTAAFAHYMGFGTKKDGWQAATTMPHGYRSSVAYDSAHKTWITVGPNGTDVSFDDGRNWKALRPDPAFHEEGDADKDWNALSLPFAVGPNGRIGVLRDSAVAPM